MKTQFYLVVNSNGSVSAKKNRPNLAWNEVSILMDLQLPSMLFQKPQLQGSILVEEKDVTPTHIDIETQNNIREAIESTAGLEVRLTVVNQSSDQ